MTRQYHPWQLDWNDYQMWCRSINKRLVYKNQDEFYRARTKDMSRIGWSSVRNEAELFWLKEGSPYYNVHPCLVPKLCRVNLSSIPAHLVEVPGEYKAVNIRLAEQHPELTFKTDVEITAKVKWANQISAIPAGSWVHSILMLRPTKHMLECSNLPLVRSPEELVLFLFDFNVLSKDCVRSWGIAPILWVREEDTLEDSLTTQDYLSRDHSSAYKEMVANAMRLAVTIGFMANSNDQLIEPDVLSKDRFNFETANEEERNVIVARAKRRGKIGYNVGNDLLFLDNVPGYTKFTSTGGEGRELRFAHIRSGHPHAVRYSTGHSKVKIMWFRPITVRKGLPFAKEE